MAGLHAVLPRLAQLERLIHGTTVSTNVLLQRTGATNIGQALQMLDPSVTLRGH